MRRSKTKFSEGSRAVEDERTSEAKWPQGGTRKHLSPSAMRSEPVGRIGGIAVISRRRQSHAPLYVKSRF